MSEKKIVEKKNVLDYVSDFQCTVFELSRTN